MAEREGQMVGVWLNDDEIKRLDHLGYRLGQTRLVKNNRSDVVRTLVRLADADEIINKLVIEVLAHTQTEAPNGFRVGVV